MPGYESLRTNRSDRSGEGCVTFTKSGINRIHIHCKLDCLAVEVCNNQNSISLINFYNPCKLCTLSELEEIMKKIRHPAVWVGDFNTPNPLWGSGIKDRNKAVIGELLDKYGVIVINDGKPTRYHTGKNTHSHKDLPIASSNLARVGEWDTLDS